jgi:hypothetical protein
MSVIEQNRVGAEASADRRRPLFHVFYLLAIAWHTRLALVDCAARKPDGVTKQVG